MAKITVTIEGSLIGALTVETGEFAEDLGALMVAAAAAAHPLADDGVTPNNAQQSVTAYVKQHMKSLMQQALRAKGATEAQHWDTRATDLVI